MEMASARFTEITQAVQPEIKPERPKPEKKRVKAALPAASERVKARKPKHGAVNSAES